MSIQSIGPRELLEILKRDSAIDLIDVRTPLEFSEVHVAGASNIPLDQLNPELVLQNRRSSADQPLYLICRSGGRGRQACEKFLSNGFTRVVNVEGGTQACIDAALPLVRGTAVMSLERQVRIAAGALVLCGAVLGWIVHPAFIGISAFVGAGLVFAGVTDWCGMGLLLARMPWNRCSNTAKACCAS